ncbi:MAG TPA: FAD:protein FMN transferase [Pseudonocardiaceae bacterium]|nr:FAD:protein FMN transferase [Pseudonocardiaceae bacterium]
MNTPIRAGRTEVWMDTLVTISLGLPIGEQPCWDEQLRRAFEWFAAVESACSRFDPASEVNQLVEQVGEPVEVSPILAAAIRLALRIAEDTGGVFDPVVGGRLAAAGYDRHYRTGRRWRGGRTPATNATWRDVTIDDADLVTLAEPVLLDLGGLVKGLAIDLASLEFAGCPGVLVNAGGDVYAAGIDVDGALWRVGVADPLHPGQILGAFAVANLAVATSGCYARGPHLVDPRPVPTPKERRAVSVTVVAPSAAAADGLSTAAAVLDVESATDLLESVEDVAGVLVTPSGERLSTVGFEEEWLQ